MTATGAPPKAAKPRGRKAPQETATPEPPVEAPSGTDLVVRDPTDTQQLAVIMDRHDEKMIVEELQHRALDVMLYSFDQGGSKITDLSYLGVNEAVRVMNATGKAKVTIDRDSLTVETVMEDLGRGPELCWQATVYAVNDLTGYGQFATCTQPKRMKLKDARAVKRAKERGDYVDENDTIADKFSRQKAVNKAQRNALRVHIPEAMRQTVIAQYLGDHKRVQTISAGVGAADIAQLPPPLTDDRAEQQKAEARELYDRIREITPTGILLPAVFHAYLRDAEHSHDRLDDFLGYLRDLLERNQPKEGSEDA